MTTWEHRTVVVALGDDGPVTALGVEGWEPYAVIPTSWDGYAAFDVTKVAVLLRRACG